MGHNSSKESLSDASTVIDKTGYANDVADRSNFYTFEYDNKEHDDQDYVIDETIVGTPFSRADSLHAAESRESKEEKVEVHINSVEVAQVETIANKENLKSDIVKKSKKKKKAKKMHRSRKSSHGSNREEKGRHVHMVVYFYSDDPIVSNISKEEENVEEMIEETQHADVSSFNEDDNKQTILEDDDLMSAVTSVDDVITTPTLDDSTEI